MKSAAVVLAAAVVIAFAWWKVGGDARPIAAGTTALREASGDASPGPASRPGSDASSTEPISAIPFAPGRDPVDDVASRPAEPVKTREATVVVRAHGGDLIAGAMARTPSGNFGPSKPDGIIKFNVPAGAMEAEVTVGARDYLPASIKIAPDVTATEVVLERAGAFRVKIVGAEGAQLAVKRLRVRGPSDMVTDQRMRSPYREAGALALWQYHVDTSEKTASGMFEGDVSGESTLPGFREGVEVTIEALDRFGYVAGKVQARAVFRPEPTLLHLTSAPRRASFRVVDQDGAAIPRAVAIFYSETRSAGMISSLNEEFVGAENGVVVVDGIFGTSGVLKVVRRGFAVFFQSDWAFPGPTEVGVVTLAKARDLSVLVVSGAGNPMAGATVYARPEGGDFRAGIEISEASAKAAGFPADSWMGTTDHAGLFIVHDVPVGSRVKLQVGVLGAWVEATAEPTDELVRIEAPSTGTIRVAFTKGHAGEGPYVIYAASVEKPTKMVWTAEPDTIARGAEYVSSVLRAGKYKVTVRRRGKDSEIGDVVAGPVSVEVTGDAETRVEF